MEVHLSPELQPKLDRIAAENRSASAHRVEPFVEHYRDHDAWFRQTVKSGLEQLDRGEFATHEQVSSTLANALARR